MNSDDLQKSSPGQIDCPSNNDLSSWYKLPSVTSDISDQFSAEEFKLLNKVWEYALAEKYGICLGIIARVVKIETEEAMRTFFNFVHAIASGYQDHPYHGFDHAVDVTYVVYLMLSEFRVGLRLGFSSLHNIALVISALVHDVMHGGYNNSFLIATNSEVSIKYGLQSPLEKQSYDYFTILLNKFPILDYIDLPGYTKNEAKKALEEQVYRCLMQTDLASHIEQVNFLQNFIKEHHAQLPSLRKAGNHYGLLRLMRKNTSRMRIPYYQVDKLRKRLVFKPEVSPLNITNSDPSLLTMSDKHPPAHFNTHIYKLKTSSSVSKVPYIPLTEDQISIFVGIVLHAADISNVARPYHICEQWLDRICLEFHNQGDRERELNIPISPNMDKRITKNQQIALKFTRFIVRPYYEILSIIIPNFILLLDHIVDNEVFWKVKNFITEKPPVTKCDKTEKLVDITIPKNNSRNDPPSQFFRIRSFSTTTDLYKLVTNYKPPPFEDASGTVYEYHSNINDRYYLGEHYKNSAVTFTSLTEQTCYYAPDTRRRCLSLGSVSELLNSA